MQKVPFLRRKQVQPPQSDAHDNVLTRVSSHVSTSSTMSHSQRWKRLRRPLSIISTSSAASSYEYCSSPASSRGHSHSSSMSSNFQFPPQNNDSSTPKIPQRSLSRNYSHSSSMSTSTISTTRTTKSRRHQSIYGKGSVNDLATFVPVSEESSGSLFDELTSSSDITKWITDIKEEEHEQQQQEEPMAKEKDYTFTNYNDIYEQYLKDDDNNDSNDTNDTNDLPDLSTSSDTSVLSTPPTTPSTFSFQKYSCNNGIVWVGDDDDAESYIPRSLKEDHVFDDDEDDDLKNVLKASTTVSIRSQW